MYSTSHSSQVGWPCAHHCCRLISPATGRDKVDSIACCEAGGFVFALTLASLVNIPLALVREAGKLPSIFKYASHISYSTPHDTEETRIEVGGDLIPRGTSVVVVDAVLATGRHFAQCYSFWKTVALVLKMSASRSWLSFLSTVTGNYCQSKGLAESTFKAFW